ncbi:MAG: apolipoprotein N-acyltransferase [Rikenellaceae bacterium]
MLLSQFHKRLIAVLFSVVALSVGWLGLSGVSLLVALVPLLFISEEVEDSRAGWWQMLRWTLCVFVLWNFATIWWIGFATIVGPFAATFASAAYSIVAFMAFHTARKKVGKPLAYTLLVSLWIAFEYNYTVSEFSWPWLLLGNGFSKDIWLVQWYEFTGIFGGSLWVLVTNIAIYEAISAHFSAKKSLFKSIFALFVALFPIFLSLFIYFSYASADKTEVAKRDMRVAVVQPNVDCYDKFSGDKSWQERNLLELIDDVAFKSDGADVDIIVMPETAIPGYYNESNFANANVSRRIVEQLQRNKLDATVITGANTLVTYSANSRTKTARKDRFASNYYDVFNSAVAISDNDYRANSQSVEMQIRHKARLVIGVENTPTWIFDLFKFFVIDLGGVIGQIGKGESGDIFLVDSVKVGAAVCYEALYGDFYGEFARNGAELMTIISNDGWWGDTPGHRLLYSISSLRAIEHRRAIGRSANTGISGFIDERGVSLESMGWDERGVLICDLPLNSKQTFYTMNGDYIARVSVLLAILSLLYFVVFLVKRKQYLV